LKVQEDQSPKGRELVGFQRAPAHQLKGMGKRCQLPQRGPGQSPGRKRIFERRRSQIKHLTNGQRQMSFSVTTLLCVQNCTDSFTTPRFV